MADPDKSAEATQMRWRPDVDPGTIALSGLPEDWHLPQSAPLSDAALSPTSDSIGVTVSDDPNHSIWLIDETSSGAPIGAFIPLDDMLPQRLAAVLALWRSAKDELSRLPPEITPQRRQRLILGLRALDGAADGRSHREIARGLFGTARVPAGPAWKSHHLRSRIIRLLADARALRDGGYRKLLRSGRTVRF